MAQIGVKKVRKEERKEFLLHNRMFLLFFVMLEDFWKWLWKKMCQFRPYHFIYCSLIGMRIILFADIHSKQNVRRTEILKKKEEAVQWNKKEQQPAVRQMSSKNFYSLNYAQTGD